MRPESRASFLVSVLCPRSGAYHDNGADVRSADRQATSLRALARASRGRDDRRMEASEAATLVDFVREAEERVLGPEGGEWRERLARRFDDLALAAAALLDAGDDEAALRLVGSLS